MAVSEAAARPIRGVTQGGVGFVIVDCLEAFGVHDFTDRQYGLLVIILGAAISAMQNYAENKGWVTPFLRKVPPTDVPVTG